MHLLDRKSVHVAIIVILGSIIYANTLHAPFYFDDFTNIVNAPLIRNLAIFANPLSAHRELGRRAVGAFTFALNYRFNGFEVAGYHLVNIAVHLLAAFLVYRLVSLTFRTPAFSALQNRDEAGSRAGFVALFAALLFIAHPIQTQAVTYIVQRYASLATIFYLLSLNGYIRARLLWSQSGGNRPLAGGWFAASFVAALLAWNTKETAYTLPFVALTYELLFFEGPLRKHAKALFVGMAALFCSFVAFLVFWPGEFKWNIVVGIEQAMRVQTGMSRLHYIATEFRVLVTYLRLLIFPAGQRLDYDYPISRSFLDPAVMGSAALLLALLATGLFCLRLSRREEERAPLYRLAAFGVFWLFITVSIESTIIPIVDVIFEHRMYLPSIGLFMALAAVVSRLGGSGTVIPGWPRREVVAGAAIVVLALGGLTVARNQVWGDEVAFWRDNADKTPQNPRVFLNLGRALERKGDMAGAESAYRKAIKLWPEQTDAYINLGLIYTGQGRLDEALAQFRTALTNKPELAEAHNNMGKVYGMQGRLDDALGEFLTAVRLKPTFAEPYNNIGYVYALEKRYPEALQRYGECLARNPDYDLAYVNRGNVLLTTGRTGEARADFRRALEINPANTEAAEQLKGMGR